MKKKILLTGGLGFFCTRFTKRYEEKYEILSTDKDVLNIVDGEKVLKVFKDFNPDYVIHAAAVASTEFCNNNPEIAHKINVEGAVNVAKACKAVNAKMVFISSEQVFNGNTESGPYTEDDIPNPNTVYGQTKLEAEKQIKQILEELWILRFTWLFGLPEKNCSINPNILWNTMKIALIGEKAKMPSNEFRGHTYVHELIEQFEKIFNIPYGTYHVGSHNDKSTYDIACLILKELGLENRINQLIEKDIAKYKDQPRDIRLCTDKIRQFGINFSDTENAIGKCLNEFNFKL